MGRHADSVLLLLLLVSLSGNIYQSRYAGAVQPPVQVLHVGDRVPALIGKRLDGSDVSLNFGSRPTILYVFRPSCAWCERNLDNAKALAAQAKDKFDFVAVATEDQGLDKYIKDQKLDWNVLRNATDETVRAFRLGPTPVTLVIGTGGEVIHAWAGAYGGSTAKSIEALFGVSLPGLRDMNGVNK